MSLESKIWFCGMLQNCARDADELTKDIYDYFDGLVFVDHQSTDGTKEILESRKKEGEIISIPWVFNNGWSMQAILNSKKILPEDIVCISDGLERWNPKFAKNIRHHCNIFRHNNIDIVYNHGKILLFKYQPDIFFVPVAPHCYLHVEDKKYKRFEITQIEEFKDEKNTRYSIRGERRPRESFLWHFLLYNLSYKISNQCAELPNPVEQEDLRRAFIVHWVRVLGRELTVESFLDYIKNNKLDDKITEIINTNRYFNDFYRYHVLNHTVDDLIASHKVGQLHKI